MAWSNIRIGHHLAKLTPLGMKMPKLKECDSEGREVKKIQIMKSEYKWVRIDDNKEIEKTYKLSPTGKVMRKLAKTTEINQYKTISKPRALDLNRERTYFVFCDSLQKELKDDEAIEFIYTNGNGFKIGYAVIYKEKKHLLMAYGLGYLQELAEKIDVANEKQDEEVVDRATAQDMLSLVGIEA